MTITEEIKEMKEEIKAKKLTHEGIINFHKEELTNSLEELVYMGLKKCFFRLCMKENARALRRAKAIASVYSEMLGKGAIRGVRPKTLRDKFFEQVKEYNYEQLLGFYFEEMRDMESYIRYPKVRKRKNKNYYGDRLFILKEIAKKLHSIAFKSDRPRFRFAIPKRYRYHD